jgi:hypothetical protein
MHIESYEVSYPYEKHRPGKRFGRGPLDFHLETVPDYTVMVVNVTWIDDDGAAHTEPLSQTLVDRAAAQTDPQTINHLQEFINRRE